MSMHTDSALLRAVREVFDREAAQLPELKNPVTVIIAGGIAAHYWTGMRVTGDIDAEFGLAGTGFRTFLPKDDLSYYLNEDGERQSLHIDRNYSPVLALAHEDYVDRAVPVTQDLGGAPKFSVFVLSPVDLAISKIARYSDTDQQDIESLAEAGLLDPAQLEQLANEAIAVAIGFNLDQVRHNLSHALELVRTHKPSGPGV